jgi:hypothetical protein
LSLDAASDPRFHWRDSGTLEPQSSTFRARGSAIALNGRLSLAVTGLDAHLFVPSHPYRTDGCSWRMPHLCEFVAPQRPYQVFVDGTRKGEIAGTAGALSIDGVRPGAVIDVVGEGGPQATGVLAVGARGVDSCAPSETRVPLSSTAGQVVVTWTRRVDCEQRLEIDAEDVPVGTIDVSLGSGRQGTGMARPDPRDGRVRGVVAFEGRPETGEWPLGSVEDGETIAVSGVGWSASGSLTPTAHVSRTCVPEEISTTLIGGSFMPSVAKLAISGDCERELVINTNWNFDEPVLLEVGGVSLYAGFQDANGLIRFSSRAGRSGALPLALDPRGAEIVLNNGSGPHRGVLGMGNGAPPLCANQEFDLPLLMFDFPVPAPPRAAGRVMSQTTRGCEVSLSVLVSRVPEGRYQVSVGPIRIDLDVLDLGGITLGALELDTRAPTAMPFDFRPAGQTLTVSNQVELGRKLPR